MLRQPADADLIERLLDESSGDHTIEALVRIVNKGRADLAGSPPEAMPELLERLVRQRLS